MFLLLLSSLTTAQAQRDSKEPSLSDMLEQMQQMLQQFEQGDGMSFQLPDIFGGDSLGGEGFQFKLDTAMFSDPMFRTMPYREGQDMMGMDQFFKQFEQMFGGLDPFGGGAPRGDDGTTRTDEDLLPEEQLRSEENGEPKKEKPAPKPKAKQKNAEPERKTIRI